MHAVIYLDGDAARGEHRECRCLKVGPKTTVAAIVRRMCDVQRDWESIGGGAAKVVEGDESGTDAPEDAFGLVLVTDAGDGHPPTEEVLARGLTVDSTQFDAARQAWRRTILEQMSARCIRTNAEKGLAPVADRDYWFRSAAQRGACDAWVKLVDLDQYMVAQRKAGWLEVKDKKGRRSRWVVLHEDTLRWFGKADESSPPDGVMDDVTKAKVVAKATKSKFTIELKGRKSMVTLVCENDVMWERWQEALKRGRSGTARAAGPPPAGAAAPRGVQLRLDVDMIPEFTEEEEEALERRGHVPAVGSLITAEHLAGDSYLSIESIAAQAADGGYLSSTDDVAAALIDPVNGTYLDIEGLSALAAKAGFHEANADTYISVGQLPWDGAAVDGGNLDLSTIQKLVGGTGNVYLTIDQARDLYLTLDDVDVAQAGAAAAAAPGEDLYLTVADACWWMAKNGGEPPDELPPPSRVLQGADVATRRSMGKVWVSPNGTVLTGVDCIQLCHDNGYLTVAEMQGLTRRP
mmetsp:Transcript_16047/g.41593  ORF Transcript_16047/g.41593 Transcript_16047/m.41593 type:complete len:520 (+) Transcript_16047:307-1866(+)